MISIYVCYRTGLWYLTVTCTMGIRDTYKANRELIVTNPGEQNGHGVDRFWVCIL